MQVKKFEAKTMKEALEMVKTHLGPEAIILSAKDSRNGYGLHGEKSVEITAAVSEEMLRKKLLAEQRLNQVTKEKFLSAPAKKQNEFIQKVVSKQQRQQEIKMRKFTSTPYIEIEDDENRSFSTSSVHSGYKNLTPADDSYFEEAERTHAPVAIAGQRIKGAAERALSGAAQFLEDESRSLRSAASAAATEREDAPEDSHELQSLRKEIHRLQKLVKGFQTIPQNFATLHPGADDGIPYDLSFMFEKLIRAGVMKDFCVQALRELEQALPRDKWKSKAFVSAWVARYILDYTKIADNRTLNKYHVFVGPSGHGKTSSLVKLASHMVIRERKSIAIVTTDTKKVGASEQLKIYAQILNVPFAVIRRKQDWQILEQKLAKVDCILVDSPGMHLKSMAEIDFLRDILPPETGGRSIHYVQSSLSRDDVASDVASRFVTLPLSDVIFTNIDETTHHGIIFNFQKKFELPLHSFGIGPHIPEDIEPATKERVVDLIFKITKFKKQEAVHE
jgi:flagellar biosynthesis protein FlhF